MPPFLISFDDSSMCSVFSYSSAKIQSTNTLMKQILDYGENYRQHCDLPALAGVAAFPDAIGKGLSIENCVARLKRYHFALRRLYEIFNDHITSEPVYELKMVFSLHSHYCAEHVMAMRKRVGEMREPPLGLDRVPDEHLQLLFDELLAQRDVGARLRGIYGIALPSLIRGLENHLEQTNPLADHPSVRVCRFALLELREMQEYGEAAMKCIEPGADAEADDWCVSLRVILAAAGGVDGTEVVEEDVERERIRPMCSADA